MNDIEVLVDELYATKREELEQIDMFVLVDDTDLYQWCYEKITNDLITIAENREQEKKEDEIIQTSRRSGK